MRASDLMSAEVVTVPPETPVAALVRRLAGTEERPPG